MTDTPPTLPEEAGAGDAAKKSSGRSVVQPRVPGGAFGPSKFVPRGDRVTLVLKPHPLFVLLRAGGVAAVVIALAVITGWGIRASGLAPGARTVTLIAALLIALKLGWSVLEWLARWYVLTDRRIIRVGGVLRQYAGELPLGRVQSIAVVRPFRERLFGLGTLGVATAGTGDYEIVWMTIARPHVVMDAVRNACDSASDAAAKGEDPA